MEISFTKRSRSSTPITSTPPLPSQVYRSFWRSRFVFGTTSTQVELPAHSFHRFAKRALSTPSCHSFHRPSGGGDATTILMRQQSTAIDSWSRFTTIRVDLQSSCSIYHPSFQDSFIHQYIRWFVPQRTQHRLQNVLHNWRPTNHRKCIFCRGKMSMLNDHL